MDIRDFDLDDLHDGILAEVVITWEKFARAKLKIIPNEYYIKPSRPIIIIGDPCTGFICPQELPWGPSDFVNNAALTTESEVTQLDIEMQSGDVIQLKAKAISFSFEE